MEVNEELFLESLSWEQIQNEVKDANAELAKIIDNISPPKKLRLVKANYLFGDLIVNNGAAFLRKDKNTLLTTSEASKILNLDLSYSPIPMLLTLNKSNEVFIDTGSRVIPLNIFYAGSLLGLFETMDFLYSYHASPRWCVSAGARSIFTLPKIGEKKGLKKLKSYCKIPKDTNLRNLSDHWTIFKSISNSPEFSHNWLNTLVFFPQDWLIKIKTDSEFSELRDYLFKNVWFQSQFAISRIELSLSWENFVDAISSRNLNPTPYLADQTKHIISIASGKSPGFRPADGTDTSAPINLIQETITHTYSLKEYIPTIMHTYSLTQDINLPIYYSLSFPTLLEGSPNKKSGSTRMLDQKEIKQIIETLNRSSQSNAKYKNNVIETTKFEYFHVEEDKDKEITPSKFIPDSDQTFISEMNKFPGRHFCATAPFWRGCIMIQKLKSIS